MRATVSGSMLAGAVLLLLLASALPPAQARFCKKRRATNVLPHELEVNPQPLEELLSDTELPKQFDWGNVDGHSWIAPSWNQHIPQYCGSCWLHGTLSMVQDRLKIDKMRAGVAGPDVMLARQVVLNCAPFHGYSQGCDGGDVIDVLRYMRRYGLPDETCLPYSATDYTKYGKHARRCPADGYCTNCMPLEGKDTCWAVKRPIRYNLAGYGQVKAKGPGAELAMRNEIYARGPITCSMAVPEEFDYGYHRGVFVDTSNSTDVDHDVEVVGWGETDEGMKYWLVRNSWGSYWGDLGFFRIQRGVNALQLEAGDCWYALPTWEDEADVLSGKKVGTMWGIFDKEEAEKFKPEPGTHPHKRRAWDSEPEHGEQERQQEQGERQAGASEPVRVQAGAWAGFKGSVQQALHMLDGVME